MSSVTKPEPSPLAQATPFATLPPFVTPAPPTPEALAVLAEVQKLQAADPVADFEKAWQQGDRRFAVVRGAGLYVPGIKEEKCAALLNQYGAKVICTPGDVNLTDEKKQLGEAGVKYATRYNELLLKKLNMK